MEIKEVIIFGASGHGAVIADSIQASGDHVVQILDDKPVSDEMYGIPVVHTKDVELGQTDCAVIAVGNNRTRKSIALRLHVIYCTVIHPNAVISRSAKIDEGTVIMAGAILNAGSIVGKHCIINTSAVIEHDCNISDFVHISPNTGLAGNVSVGEGTHIGIGASVIQGLRIGKWVTVGAGAVVIDDIPDYAVVVGNPARIIKYNTEL